MVSLSVESNNEGPTFLTKVEPGKNEQRIQVLVDKNIQVVGFEYFAAGDVFVEIGGLFAIFGSLLYALCAMIGLFAGASFLNVTADLIQKKYEENKNIYAIKKSLFKFEKCHKALNGQQQYKDLVAEMEKFMKVKYQDLSGEQIFNL